MDSNSDLVTPPDHAYSLPASVSFLLLEQIPETNTGGEQAYLGSQFRRLQSMDGWPDGFWACGEAAHVARECVMQLSTRQRKEGRGSHHSLQGHALNEQKASQ